VERNKQANYKHAVNFMIAFSTFVNLRAPITTGEPKIVQRASQREVVRRRAEQQQ